MTLFGNLGNIFLPTLGFVLFLLKTKNEKDIENPPKETGISCPQSKVWQQSEKGQVRTHPAPWTPVPAQAV